MHFIRQSCNFHFAVQRLVRFQDWRRAKTRTLYFKLILVMLLILDSTSDVVLTYDKQALTRLTCLISTCLLSSCDPCWYMDICDKHMKGDMNVSVKRVQVSVQPIVGWVVKSCWSTKKNILPQWGNGLPYLDTSQLFGQHDFGLSG